jgi:uncharacterized Zn finger protein (UPF0148 family)
MPRPKEKAEIEKPVCEKCGVDVRENTLFCYNCGSRVGGDALEDAAESVSEPETDVDAKSRAALDELAERLKADELADEGKLARAASERRQARVSHRRSREYAWEPRDNDSNRFVVLFAVAVAVLAAIIVVLAVLR